MLDRRCPKARNHSQKVSGVEPDLSMTLQYLPEGMHSSCLLHEILPTGDAWGAVFGCLADP